MPLPARLIFDPPAAGTWNMAVDQALLSSAASQGHPTLRIYRWEEATLSLGYFQQAGQRQGHPASSRCPMPAFTLSSSFCEAPDSLALMYASF